MGWMVHLHCLFDWIQKHLGMLNLHMCLRIDTNATQHICINCVTMVKGWAPLGPRAIVRLIFDMSVRVLPEKIK